MHTCALTHMYLKTLVLLRATKKCWYRALVNEKGNGQHHWECTRTCTHTYLNLQQYIYGTFNCHILQTHLIVWNSQMKNSVDEWNFVFLIHGLLRYEHLTLCGFLNAMCKKKSPSKFCFSRKFRFTVNK
jgi:hypothetical protein